MRLNCLVLVFLLFCDTIHADGLIAGALITPVAAALSFACPPAGIGLAVSKVVTAGVMCCVTYFAYKKHCKNKKKKKKQEEKTAVVCSGAAGGGGKDPKDEKENDPQKHPHGIYEDIRYHTKKSTSTKSACPQNGQEALDNSISIGPNSTGRIGISNNEIVVLRKSLDRLHSGRWVKVYHGYATTWGELHGSLQTVLIKNGLSSSSGRLLNL